MLEVREGEPIAAPEVAHEMGRQYGPLGLPLVDTTYMDDEQYGFVYADHHWAHHRYSAPEGTPTAPDGQHDTYAGVNPGLLLRAGRLQRRRMLTRAGTTAALLVVTFSALLAAGPLTVPWAAFVGATLLGTGYVVWHTKPDVLGRVLGWFEPDATNCLREALAGIPLAELAGETVLSGVLWDLGLGKRLAHLTPAAHEVMVALAPEARRDLAQLAEMAEGVTTP